jgi:hypothetical protein
MLLKVRDMTKKRIPKSRIQETDGKSCGGASEARRVLKGKRVWYAKTSSWTNNKEFSTYEQQSALSYLYRFLLGPDRAAKSLPLVDENDFPIEVISQTNPKGFKWLGGYIITEYNNYVREKLVNAGVTFKIKNGKEIKEISDDTDEIRMLLKAYDSQSSQAIIFNYLETHYYKNEPYFKDHFIDYRLQLLEKYLQEYKIAGMYDIDLADYLFAENDQNIANRGLNDDFEVSKIDYDFGMSFGANKYISPFPYIDGLIENNKIKDFFGRAERELVALNDAKALKRFYECQLRAALLNDEILNIILRRSITSETQIKDDIKYILERQKSVNEILMRSSGFKEFLKNLTEDDLSKLVLPFFQKQDGTIRKGLDLWQPILKSFNSLKEKFDEIKDEKGKQKIQNDKNILYGSNEPKDNDVNTQTFKKIKRQSFKSEEMKNLCDHGKDHKKKEEHIYKYLTCLINAENIDEFANVINNVPQELIVNTGLGLYGFFHQGDKSTTDTLVKKLIAKFDNIKNANENNKILVGNGNTVEVSKKP